MTYIEGQEMKNTRKKHSPAFKAKDAQIDQLYRRIGQLKVERDFLAERSGL